MSVFLASRNAATASTSSSAAVPKKMLLTPKVESRKKPERKVPTKLPSDPNMLIVPAAAPTCVSFSVRL